MTPTTMSDSTSTEDSVTLLVPAAHVPAMQLVASILQDTQLDGYFVLLLTLPKEAMQALLEAVESSDNLPPHTLRLIRKAMVRHDPG